VTGRIFDIQRFSVHDGPGIRTTVFLKGCYLRCLWCHNPESQNPQPELSYLPSKCISCNSCQDVCADGALTFPAATPPPAVNHTACTDCAKCAEQCDAGALEMVGRGASVDSIMEVVLRDKAYYVESKGGLTISGGDPLFQPQFTLALATAAKREGLHVTLETSGFCKWQELEPLAAVVDLFFYDYKETSPALHKSFTGVSPDTIIANLANLHGRGANIVLRCPMIPEFNARREHLDGIAATAKRLPKIRAVELLPYHRLGRSKLERFGLATRMPGSVEPPEFETVEGWVNHVGSQGVRMVRQTSPSEAACGEMPSLCTSI
jgi:pyruvate formate lyase activating enzyme